MLRRLIEWWYDCRLTPKSECEYEDETRLTYDDYEALQEKHDNLADAYDDLDESYDYLSEDYDQLKADFDALFDVNCDLTKENEAYHRRMKQISLALITADSMLKHLTENDLNVDERSAIVFDFVEKHEDGVEYELVAKKE